MTRPTYAPSMNSALWAKLTTPIMPNTRVSPAATRTRFAPTVRPISTCVSTPSRLTPRLSQRAGARAGPPSQLARARVRVRHLLQHVDHDVAQRLRLHDPHVEILDGVVVLRVEAERAARAVDPHHLEDLDQALLVGDVALGLPERADE